jgi:Trk K+ transport system NAD-binding subunit
MRVIIVGGGKVGRDLATRLDARGEDVVIIEQNEEIVEIARKERFSVHIGNGADRNVLQAAGVEKASKVVATTGDDDVNLLVAQLASSSFDTEQVIARVNQPDNEDAFAQLDVETISAPIATSWAIDNHIERPALWNWITELDRSGDVQEFGGVAKSSRLCLW